MSYFTLPKINNNNIYKNFNPIYSNKEDFNSIINKTLSIYLNTIKLEIEKYNSKWDIYKKYTNPYEYIHTIIDTNYKQSVSIYRPLSRSFYKMIEICDTFNIFNNINNTIKTFHLAEGPGGFIEAICYIRNNNLDKYYGMTLINNNDNNIPGWNKSITFLNKNQNVSIEYGKDKTGDLLNCENLLYVYNKYKNSCYFVTADGGFDFTTNFNNQEIVCSNLIFAQIAYIVATQQHNGHCVIKMFDNFTKFSIDILFLLSTFYKEVHIIKLNTSRYANSEKYIVCKNFKLTNVDNYIQHFYEIIKNIPNDKYISNLLINKIPYLFINKLEEYNSIFGQQQIENILTTLNLINNSKKEKLDYLKKNNIQKCIYWCNKYNLDYNKTFIINNVFIKFSSETINDPSLHNNDNDNDKNNNNTNIKINISNNKI